MFRRANRLLLPVFVAAGLIVCLAQTGNSEDVNTRSPVTKSDNTTTSTKAAHHSVTLTWKPSIPATKSSQDAIVGYMVYRSTKPNDSKAKPVTANRVLGTTYVDTQVEPGKVYYYVTRAISARGKLSAPSNETRAQIPR